MIGQLTENLLAIILIIAESHFSCKNIYEREIFDYANLTMLSGHFG